MAAQIRILIVGAGPVGLTIAALLGRSKVAGQLEICLVDARPLRAWSAASMDLRVYALARRSAATLEAAGAWGAITACRASAYRRMCVWEDDNWPTQAMLEIDSTDAATSELGHIVEDSLLCHALAESVAALPACHIRTGITIEAIEPRPRALRVHCGGQAALDDASLVIAADGGQSPLRGLAGLRTVGRDYGQSALVAHLRSSEPHRATAWQRFLPGGPLALLPLDDGRSSLVWSLPRDAAAAHARNTAAAFNAAVTAAAGQMLGELTLDSERAVLPLVARHAPAYSQPRLVLAGDAAHVVHPLAGQGANLGFADAASLAETLIAAITAGQDPGDLRVLRRYERARQGANLAALLTLDGIDRLFRGPRALAGLRRSALGLAGQVPAIRRGLIRAAGS